MKDRFGLLGVKTADITVLTKTFVATTEPENLKCVLASKFSSYGLGEHRKKSLGPLLGEGIFTTDGHEWVFSFSSIEQVFFSCDKPFQSDM